MKNLLILIKSVERILYVSKFSILSFVGQSFDLHCQNWYFHIKQIIEISNSNTSLNQAILEFISDDL